MRTAFAIVATLGLALAACERAPVDGTEEEPAPDARTAGAAATPYDGPIPMPIRIGTDGPDADSCASYGEVTGLDAAGETYLSVRDAPSLDVKERDRLDPGQGVHICGESNGWYGVVYDNSDEAQECGIAEPVSEPTNYTGPCAQGWVQSDFVTIVAG
ncbi:SH3 domain-containing protein [Alteriqipengyuania lutimaris]|uniref:SH3 domain-containing protein n=1 Tax=Alteriqipengyuania lutimaris TaxID=1538146 RepID=A0A395LNP8_9SPHN|nr:hypothetical protein [Alteriqipengyuania lutimaris]MBB3032874.1 hypothetical protein [Alteriqipengyuania lutimaris]RDS78037.1 hypothetical protein DL238_10785 [Alteriqipengyuania lutimaris]